MMQGGRTVYTVEIRGANGRPEIVEFEGPDGLDEGQLTQLADQHLRTARPGQQFPGSVIDPRSRGSFPGGTPGTRLGPEGIEVDIEGGTRPTASGQVAGQIGWGATLPVMGAVDALAGAAQGVGQVFDNAAELAQGAYNNTLGRVFGESDSATRANEAGQGFEGLANNLGQGSEVGRVGGQIGASTLLTRGLGGPFAQGAGAGALMSEADSGWGVARDAALGGAGSVIVDRFVRGLSSAIAPRVEPAVRALHERGVRMTPGQMIPGLNRWEEMSISRPGVGPAIERGRQQSYVDFNRAAIDEVVAPYNAVGSAPVRVPRNATGTGVIRSIGDQLSSRYERLIPRLRLNPDRELADDIVALGGTLRSGDMTPAAVNQFERIVRNQVMSRLSGGPLDGATYRQIERSLGAQIRRYSRSQEPDNQAMASAFEELQTAFQRALQRSNPASAAELRALNESWANLVRVEGAAAGARGGLFSPLQFRQAVRRADNSTRGRAMARGEARMQELADAGADVLPNEYPNSRTADRMQMGFTNPNFWAGWAQRPLYTEAAQRAAQNLLLSARPPAAQPVADFLRTLPTPQAAALGVGSVVSPFFSSIP